MAAPTGIRENKLDSDVWARGKMAAPTGIRENKLDSDVWVRGEGSQVSGNINNHLLCLIDCVRIHAEY